MEIENFNGFLIYSYIYIYPALSVTSLVNNLMIIYSNVQIGKPYDLTNIKVVPNTILKRNENSEARSS